MLRNQVIQVFATGIAQNQPGAGPVWTQLMREHTSDPYGHQIVKLVPTYDEKQYPKTRCPNLLQIELLVISRAEAQYGHNSCGSMEANHTSIKS